MSRKYVMGMLGALFLTGVFLSFFFAGKPAMPSDKLTVVASFYPLYFFAEEIAGERAEVITLTPFDREPHDYELTAEDLARIESARLVIVNGGGLEPWGEKITQNIDPNKTLIVTTGEDLTTEQIVEDGEITVDPHVWLSPALAGDMVDKIAAGFAQADASNALYYRANAAGLKSKLNDLDVQYRQSLSSCEKKDIITSHAAFGYLARSYGLHQIPIAGLSPDAEPSPKQLGTIIQFAKEHDVRYIFFESFVSPKLSETIATEVGAQTLVLHTVEGLPPSERDAGEDYFTLMYENLVNLTIALECL